MNTKEQTFFFKRLAFLMNAHIPLAESLQVLCEQASTNKHRIIFDHMLADVTEGQSLSRACGKFPQVFGEFSLSMIQVGEQSGTLAQTLEYVAAELKKKQLLRAKVVGAFIYPAIIALATLGITAFLILYLFPKITPIFASLHAHLPLSTRIVMGVSTFLQHYGIIFLAGTVFVVAGSVYVCRRNDRMRAMLERVVLRAPLVGSLLQLYHISNISRTLGLLLTSGVTLHDAVRITADATPNLVYKRECNALGEVVVHGAQISSHFTAAHDYFPPMFCHMVAVGERSGTLSETLLYMADLYDAEVDEFTKNLSTLIEPLLMVGMGILVGFIAISIITPIYAITQNLHA